MGGGGEGYCLAWLDAPPPLVHSVWQAMCTQYHQIHTDAKVLVITVIYIFSAGMRPWTILKPRVGVACRYYYYTFYTKIKKHFQH